MTGTFHENLYVFTLISRRIHLRMRKVSDKFPEKMKTRILYSTNFLPIIVPFMILCGKLRQNQTGHRRHKIHRMRCPFWIIQT